MSSTQKRSIGPIALMFTGLGSIIGSGWLFGAWHTAKIAGPAAILAWVIGAVVIRLRPSPRCNTWLHGHTHGRRGS